MNLLQRIKAILLTPRTEWPVIAQESTGVLDLFIKYVAILAAIPEVAHFIGQSLIGADRAPIMSGLMRAVIAYLTTWVMVYLIAAVINFLAPRFGGTRNFASALKLSVYSHTPLWLAGVFLLILGVYGLYLLWVGLPVLMQVPDERAFPYAIFATACALIPAVVLAIV